MVPSLRTTAIKIVKSLFVNVCLGAIIAPAIISMFNQSLLVIAFSMQKMPIEVRARKIVLKYSNQDCANASLRLVTTVALDEPLELLSPFSIESGLLTTCFLEGSGRRTPLASPGDTGGKRGAGNPSLELKLKCRCAVGFCESKENAAWEQVRLAHKVAFHSRFSLTFDAIVPCSEVVCICTTHLNSTTTRTRLYHRIDSQRASLIVIPANLGAFGLVYPSEAPHALQSWAFFQPEYVALVLKNHKNSTIKIQLQVDCLPSEEFPRESDDTSTEGTTICTICSSFCSS